MSIEKFNMIDRDLEIFKKSFPGIRFIDLGKPKIERDFLVANIQIETPIDYFTETTPPKLTIQAEKDQKRKIEKYIQEAIKKEADLIVLPELSTSQRICNELMKKFQDSKSIIVMGSHYDKYSGNHCPIYVNNKEEIQWKINPSLKEKDYMKSSSIINVFINTPIGDFTVLICYDATDFSILSALQGYTDLIICPAKTQDVVTFKNIFSALTYLQYQYVVFCNDGVYGGSSFYLPFHRNRAQDVMGVKNEGIIFRKFNLIELDNIRANPRKDDVFKYPPASISPRHIPNVDINKRKEKYFQSQSFNFLVWDLEILNSFLASINTTNYSQVLKKGVSPFRLLDIISKSLQVASVPPLDVKFMGLDNILFKFYLLGRLKLFESNNLIKNITSEEPIKEAILKIKGKQYLLFEIDNDLIKNALNSTPELVDELNRIYQIDKEKRIIQIPEKYLEKTKDWEEIIPPE